MGFRDTDMRKGNAMSIKAMLSSVVLGAMLLGAGGCATKEDLQGYATKEELSALRAELMEEIRKAQENAAASAAAAKTAAADARSASEKADAIFRQSVRK